MKTKLPFCQRGAMFGLDARIALAIFGGLSIITGAVLYTVIGEIGITRRTTELSNIGKAIQGYVLDTGVYPTNLEDLISSSITGWKGPYLQLEDSDATVNNILKMSTGDDVVLYYRRDSNWANVLAAPACPSGVNNCGIYLGVLVDQAVGSKIDERVDGAASPTTGNVRLNAVGAFYTMAYNVGYRP
jgi:hypothetical protein